MNSITPDDLLLYLYNEASAEMSVAIKSALETDYRLQESMNELIVSMENLEQVSYSPRQQSVDNILAYAQKTINSEA